MRDACAVHAWLVVLAVALLAGCGMVASVTGEDVNREIRERGLPAEATVLSVADSGVRVNDDPVVELELEVTAPGRAPWRARTRQLVSIVALWAVQPGAHLQVRYDPVDPSRVAVETETGEPAPRGLPAGPAAIGAGVTVERIADGVFLHVSVHDVGEWKNVAANGLVVVGGREAALVNTAWTDEQTTRLVEWLGEEGGLHVTAVVPTHFHEDTIGGLAAAHRAGVCSYGLERTAELAPRDGFPAPQVTFTEKLTLSVGGRALELSYPGPGHTEDNIVAYVPDVRVLFGGCLVKGAEATSLGNVADADVAGWPQSVEKLQRAYPEAVVVVPGHGRPGGLELLAHTLELLRQAQAAP